MDCSYQKTKADARAMDKQVYNSGMVTLRLAIHLNTRMVYI